MNIGLLMVNGENDVLERTLAANLELVDCFYALDGTDPNTESREIIEATGKCSGYLTDREVGGQPRDGWRGRLLDRAYAEHGHDHWFLLLHGDEVWTGLPDPTGGHDGFLFPLPMYFPRDGEPWDDARHPLDQLRWHLAPGYAEFRMFHGGDDVRYDPAQHFNVVPSGIASIGRCDHPIRHYLYRSPDAQRERAAQHARSGFDPGNYTHIMERDAVYWTDEMIENYRREPHWQQLSRDIELLQIPAEFDPVAAIYREHAPRRVLEIGCWDGGTLKVWLEHCGQDATVVAVDPEHRNPGQYEAWRKPDTSLLVVHARSQDAAETIADHAPYDWVFIDGDHAEAAVRADVELCLPLVSSGGCLLLHDITPPHGNNSSGPRTILAELEASGCRVERFEEQNRDPWTHGIGLVRL